MYASTLKRASPANRMVFDVRRDMALVKRFAEDLEGLMADYGLSNAEREAFRARDLQRMVELGVHPYFLTQITRLYHGSANNHQGSAAIEAYRKGLVEPAKAAG